MRLRVFVVVFTSMSLLGSFSGSAQQKEISDSNSILGKWSSTGSCQKPDFVFKKKSAIILLNADGYAQPYQFTKVEYLVAGFRRLNIYFKEEHGLGISAKPTSIEIMQEAPDKAVIIADHGSDLILIRCP